MTHIDNLLIAFSEHFQDPQAYASVVSKVLGGSIPEQVSAVNDFCSYASKDSRFSGRIKDVKCKSRIEARRLVAAASHVVCFWSGEDLQALIWEARHQKKPLRIHTFSHTSVVNRDKGDEFDIYIGRSGPWGNPFPIVPGTEETRERVIEKYREHFETAILSDPSMHKALLGLRGLRLGCHCKPLACHGDVIARYLNNYRDPEES